MNWTKQIPGQVKANTWVLLVIGLCITVPTGDWLKMLGAIVVPCGVYFGEQTAHLVHHHRQHLKRHGKPDMEGLVWIEIQQQLSAKFFQYGGDIIYGIGFALAVFG